MEDDSWRQFFKTGSIRDYLSYKSCVDEKEHFREAADYEGETSGKSNDSDRNGAGSDTGR